MYINRKYNNLVKYKKNIVILSKNKINISLNNIEAPMPAREILEL